MNNQAPELSREARRLIAEARGADDPTADDQARVKARWLASVAAVAGVSSLTEAARAAGGIGWGLKAAGAALAIAAGAIGVNLLLDAGGPEEGGRKGAGVTSQSANKGGPAASLPGSGGTHERFQKAPSRRDAREEPNALVQRPVAAVTESAPSFSVPSSPSVSEHDGVAPSPALVGLPSPASPAEAAVAESPAHGPAAQSPAAVTAAHPPAVRPRAVRAVAARASTPKAAVPATPSQGEAASPEAADGPSGQLSEELAVLSEVRSSIQAGAPTRALDLLSRYEARFGQPILGMEADALRVDALCKAGRQDAARASARAFQNEWPGSPLQRRVSAACP